MKAAVLRKTGESLLLEELDLPELKEGQVLAKILFTGVCRAQLNEIKALKGPDKYLPHTLGHEASGIIEEVGPGVTKVKKGDYVVLTWIKAKGKDIPSCHYVSKEGSVNSGAITTFNEYSVISENRVVKISEKVPPEIAALLGCAIPTGAGIVKNQIKLSKENSIAIFGIGGVGASSLLAAASVGASPIIAVDVNQKKLEFAKENGATHFIDASKEDVVKEIDNIGKVDYSIDCTGSTEAIENAFDSVKDDGVTVVAGNPGKGEKIRITPFDLIKGKRIIGSWGGKTDPDVDLPFYAQQYLDGKLKIDSLITKIYSLDEINSAIDDLKNGKVVRALVKVS